MCANKVLIRCLCLNVDAVLLLASSLLLLPFMQNIYVNFEQKMYIHILLF